MVKKIGLLIVFCSLVFASYSMVVKKDVIFHTDIARDFLLLERIVKTKRPTLIGGRSGGIPGMFHGPAWLYVNLPGFLMGQGSPEVVALWWLFLGASFVLASGLAAKKIFGKSVGWLAAGLAASGFIPELNNLLNPHGAIWAFLGLFYFLNQYFKTLKSRYLALGVFFIGMAIQFQVAFGGPILVLSLPYIVFKIIKSKKFSHLLVLGVIALPLSTFLVFDLRNNWLQTRSLIKYLTADKGDYQLALLPFLKERFWGFFTGATYFVSAKNQVLAGLSALFLIYFGWLAYKAKRFWHEFKFFAWLYVGFWIITIPFKGTLWAYYYQPFVGVSPLLLASGYKLCTKKLFGLFFVVLVGANLIYGYRHMRRSIEFAGSDLNSWQFYKKMSQRIFTQAPEEFGYYIFSPDLFGYSPRYALNYINDQSSKSAIAFEKKPTTFLIYVPKGNNPFVDPVWWKEKQVKIEKQPRWHYKYENGLIIEEYRLNESELSTPSDPTLLQNLHFR